MTASDRRPLRVLSRHEVRQALREEGTLSLSDLAILENADAFLAFGKGPFPENAAGHYPLHLCVGGPLRVNGVERRIAMATEELGIVAGLGRIARTLPSKDGITVQVAKRNRVRGQILFHHVMDAARKVRQIEDYGGVYVRSAHQSWDPMVKHGGGLIGFTPRVILAANGRPTLALDIEADTGESMGANVITRMGDLLAASMAFLVGQVGHTSICTNHRSGWHVVATGAFHMDGVHAFRAASGIVDLQAFAEQDIGRAVTHNKGVLNGISAVATATGQDVRAIEAACHAEASWHGGIRPLTTLTNRSGSTVVGRLELTLPVGTVGGATQEPIAMVCRKLMGVTGSRDLAGIMAAVGLAQNVAALRMLATEGVTDSHRRLRRK
jgi:hydroxymethylglutaryl-CoA reductase